MNALSQSGLPSLDGLFNDPAVPATDDATFIASYLGTNPQYPPILMSIGDPYLLGAELPAVLGQYEHQAPSYLGGYSRTPAGLPQARRLIAELTIQQNHLDQYSNFGQDFDLHLTSGTGTRGIMGDFGRLLIDQSAGDSRIPVVLCAAPCWDYAGVFMSLGYEMSFWPLKPQNHWLPDIDDAQAAVAAIDADPTRRLALVIVNTDHNPTGTSWPVSVLEALFMLATSRQAGILLDDPYRFVITDDAQPVSAPNVLFKHLADPATPPAARRRWCRVESFGKAFICNDWGIGSIMAHPAVLNHLAQYTFRWSFPKAARRQWAMAQWLTDPACQQYLSAARASLGRKRQLWAQTLRAQGWPPDLTPVGTATPYYLMALPPRYRDQPDGARKWRQELLDATGILFGHASIEQQQTAADIPYLRAYLGGDEFVVNEAAARLAAAGVRYE